MCGIAGRLNFRSGAPADPGVIEQMCDLLAHRGPDGHGVLVNGPLGLGHRRLAILDLSDAGRQPMVDAAAGLSITFNGEIYNFAHIRAELEQRGHAFRSDTDTEVLLAAYREYGVECLSRLRGMFVFAIWDEPRRRLFIARDRVGKKPLHYRLDGDGIAFASEPKAFLADPSFCARPNVTALSHYLSYQFVPSPFSAFEGVSKLPPAHYMLIENGEVSVRRYWELRYSPKRQVTESEACEELLQRLEDSVKLRMISDVPLGAFLSGGVDSSAVVAMMARLSGSPVKTFSIGFEEAEYNELPYARAVAERFGTEHHEFIVRPDAAEIFDALVWHYNEPYADESAIPTFYLSKLTRQHVTVALNGDGGDESFAGYKRYRLANALGSSRFQGFRQRAARAGADLLPVPARSDALAWRGKRRLQREAIDPDERYAWGMMHFDPFLKEQICRPEFLARAGGDTSAMLLAETFRRSDGSTSVERMMATDIAYYLPDCLLVKVDIATMAYGLEGRSPLLDHEFMEFAATLPSDMKLQGGTSAKHVFRKAIRRVLPGEVLDRPKMGFGVPLDHWFRGELRELAYDTLLGRHMRERGYFQMGMVKRLLDEHVSGVARWEDQLWNLLMLELWHQRFIDNRWSAARPGAGAVLATA